MAAESTQIILDRRAFLKLGAASTVALAAAGVAGTLAGCDRREVAAAQGYGFLRDADLALFRAVAPAVLEGLPLDDALMADALRGIDQLLARSEKAARDAFVQLLDLLHLAPTRWLTTGVAAGWSTATPEEVRGFLERWRASRVALFNMAMGPWRGSSAPAISRPRAATRRPATPARSRASTTQ